MTAPISLANWVLRVDEIDKLVTCATPAYRNAVAVAAYCGLRASEVAGLVWDDVDFVDGCIRVRAQLAPLRGGEQPRRVKLKSRASSRMVVLLERATEALLDQLQREQAKGSRCASMRRTRGTRRPSSPMF
jgi:integrase